MASTRRTVEDRRKSLQPVPEEVSFSLGGVQMMYKGVGGEEFHCTISEYCRTRVFEFPGVHFQPSDEETHIEIYRSDSVQASVTSNLVEYFDGAANGKHYGLSPYLQNKVREVDATVSAQHKDSVPVFVAIEEFSQLSSVEMVKGECSILDEIAVRDGTEIQMLVGGRKGRKFLTAWLTIEGAWPDLPHDEHVVNMILAGVRSGQETADPIRKYVDTDCLVTDDSRYVTMMRPTASMRAGVVTDMDSAGLESRVSEIADAITAMEQDIGTPHLVLLVNSMYSDEHKDDPYKRLQYLQLWQSLADAARKALEYTGDIRHDRVVVAGNHTPEELRDYRDDLAHWWTDSIDENLLADLQRTINELIRRRYF